MRASLGLLLPALASLACLPPAAIVPEPAPAGPAVVVESEAPSRQFAILPWRVTLYARPAFEADHLSLQAGPDGDTDVDGRMVEILDRSELGWWLVETVSPDFALGLGSPRALGLEVFVLRAWTPAMPDREFTIAPDEFARAQTAAHAAEPQLATGRIVSSATATPKSLVAAGAAIYWPDETEAGEVTHPHAFYQPPMSRQTNAEAGYVLDCYALRSAMGVGHLLGTLCHRQPLDGQATAASEDGRVAVAMDEPPRRGVSQGAHVVKGALDKDIIRRIVRAHINEVRSCYNAGLQKDPSLGGQVAIQFVISSTGKVSSAQVSKDTLADPAVGVCTAKAVKRWKFPKPRGGGQVVVTYPFNFSNP